jgi:hypothetical protein
MGATTTATATAASSMATSDIQGDHSMPAAQPTKLAAA